MFLTKNRSKNKIPTASPKKKWSCCKATSFYGKVWDNFRNALIGESYMLIFSKTD
jgi:hypothetical protein